MNPIENIYRHYCIAGKVTTDSRKVDKNAVFFALKGEHFDGNDFALDTAKKGEASLVVCDRNDIPDHERIVKVDNALTALQELAVMHRNNMTARVLSITGTNGKTTTKELVASVLRQSYHIIHTEGNLNNHIGVPLTLLNIKPETQIAIVEMGANHPKEIETLARLARPDYGIITNIGKAHLEGFGGFEGVVKTKNELYCYLREHNGTAFVNIENPLLIKLSADLKRYTYGANSQADYCIERQSCNPFLSVKYKGQTIQTRLVGDYNFENVAAAIAVGLHFEVPEQKTVTALEAYEPSNNRSQVIQTAANRIIMDAYNANPVSMQAAIRNFKTICSEKNLLVLGDMRELGKDSDMEHHTILQLIETLGFKQAFLVGPEFSKICSSSCYQTFETVEALCQHIENHPVSGHDILIKGSRGIRLEKTLPYFQ
ncbi:MAG: UDP-N-acetylmuramoyl-tripeptide--D-alanyl-D-alanine ligase [Candidatus Limimorpha sp.]